MAVGTLKKRERLAVPEELSSSRGKLIYLYLKVQGSATLEEISEDLDIPVIALCRVFCTLEKRGIVHRNDNHYQV